ncbi:MAG: alpha/beta fold hydrolase [Xanthomonadales bacterium]|nr:alpha/beta fold hydrolase [Xanthomonadales bacterium]
MNYSEHRYSSRDGLSLYYREYGSGDNVIICLPGLTRNSKDFHDLALRLSTDFRVLCLDLRGRGQSEYDPKWRHYHPGTYAQDTWTLLDALEIDKFIIIGTSLGGMIAMVMSSQQAGRIKGVVMNDIGPEIDPVGYSRILGYAGIKADISNWQDATERAKLISGQAAPEMPDEFWQDFARKTYRENSEGIPELDMDPNIGEAIRKGVKPARILAKIRKTGILKKIAGMFIDPWDSFRTMSMPVLVLRGSISDILSDDIVDRMAAVKPDLHRALIPNRGHAPMLDEPESLAAIDNFLDRLAGE